MRSILIELKLELPAKKDIDGLVRAVQVPLRLSPGRNDLPAEIEADLRQVLSGLTSVAKGIGALRTHGGRCPQPGDQRQDIGKHLPRYHDFGHLNRHSPETEAVPKEGDSKTAADCLIGRVERLLVRRAIRPLPSVGPQPADCSVVSAGTH